MTNTLLIPSRNSSPTAPRFTVTLDDGTVLYGLTRTEVVTAHNVTVGTVLTTLAERRAWNAVHVTNA